MRVAKSAATKAAEFGIEIVDVRTKRADLPEEVEQSVFQRMRAERQRESSLFRAEGEEQANIIRAQADRNATVISAEGYQQSQKLAVRGKRKRYPSTPRHSGEIRSSTRSLAGLRRMRRR